MEKIGLGYLDDQVQEILDIVDKYMRKTPLARLGCLSCYVIATLNSGAGSHINSEVAFDSLMKGRGKLFPDESFEVLSETFNMIAELESFPLHSLVVAALSLMDTIETAEREMIEDMEET